MYAQTLGALADKCAAFAKALHYKEIEFQTSPATTCEALISINNQLDLPEAAVGILLYAQQNYDIELKESWYEKLQRWDQAKEVHQPHFFSLFFSPCGCYCYGNNVFNCNLFLFIFVSQVYERKQKVRPDDMELTMGRMRCHHALAEWEVRNEKNIREKGLFVDVSLSADAAFSPFVDELRRS
jgi:FKBP12-rapamycin complex-associated protein